MRRTILAVVAAITLPAGTLCVPSLPAAATPLAGPVAAAPAMMTALQRDLGLTRDQAQARLAREQRAGHTEATLRRTLRGSFAGAWLDADATSLTVAVTSAARAADVRAAGAHPVVVARSAATLDAAKSQLDRNSHRAAPSAIPGWYVDVVTNTVVVLARDTAAGHAFVAGSGVDPTLVRVVASTQTPRLVYDVRGGDKYYREGKYCSVGFSVGGGFVTAGHCGITGISTQGYNQVAQGGVEGSSFPGNDYGWVRVNANWTPRPWVNDYAGGNLIVTGAVEAAVGASVCRSGVRTGWQCGTIQAKNVTVNYAQGQVTGLTRTNACAMPGDSGGSYVSGQQAQGVASGSNFGVCDDPLGSSYFQPLQEILDVYGLTLVTSSNPNPPAPPPPPPGCTNYETTHTGSLGFGGQAVLPNNTYYESTVSGTHRGCLDGPLGANFSLYLQKWNGSSWANVASGTSPSTDEAITYTGTPGRYRYVVYALSGSGSYTVGITDP